MELIIGVSIIVFLFGLSSYMDSKKENKVYYEGTDYEKQRIKNRIDEDNRNMYNYLNLK